MHLKKLFERGIMLPVVVGMVLAEVLFTILDAVWDAFDE